MRTLIVSFLRFGSLLLRKWVPLIRRLILELVWLTSRRNIFPRYRKRMQFALDHSSLSDLESNFDTCVEDIPDDATEDGAWRLITSAVWNKLHKPKMWHQYIMRKMEIAKHIGLGP
uniref:Uncharacterized protein n=1 Tax=Aegilops tauschii subsp. strangulata TaxID=200361 RepID=A0A453S0X0_AEGTS